MLPPLEMTSMGSVIGNGNVVANTLNLGLDLDLICAASFAAEPRNGSAQGSRLKVQGSYTFARNSATRPPYVRTELSHNFIDGQTTPYCPLPAVSKDH